MFLVFLLRYPSLHHVFQQNRRGMLTRLGNAHALRKRGLRKDKPISRDVVEDVMAALPVKALRNLLNNIVWRMKRNGVFRNLKNRIDGFLVMSFDGVETVVTRKQRCRLCLSRKHKNGMVEYFHRSVVCALIGSRAHIVVGLTQLSQRDGSRKDEGELTGGKKLFKYLVRQFGHFTDVLVMDALYLCAPMINLIRSKGIHYLIRMTDETRTIYRDALEMCSAGRGWAGSFRTKNAQGKPIIVDVYDLPGMVMAGVRESVRVLRFIEHPANDKSKVLREIWCATSAADINPQTIRTMMVERWDIENNVFRQLKTGYHADHCYCHRALEQFLFILIVAFNITQLYVLQFSSTRFYASKLTMQSIVDQFRDDLLCERTDSAYAPGCT